MNKHQKVFYLNQTLERAINNGGFNQFYFNSFGNYAHEMIESLTAIKANKTASILTKANDQFPGGQVPKGRKERQGILAQIEEVTNEIWRGLDDEFYIYEDDLNSLNMEYIKAHKIDFS